MSETEENKTLVRRFFEELWNQGNMVVADELLAPTHIHHFPAGDVDGPDKRMNKLRRSALANIIAPFDMAQMFAPGRVTW